MPGPAGRFEWERLIRRADLEPTVKFVAMLLASYADADGTRIHPGITRLVNVSGKSRSTVIRAIAALTGKGFMECTFDASRGGRKGMADEYRLLYPADESVLVLNPDEEPCVTHDTCLEGDQVSFRTDQVSSATEPGVTHDTPPQQHQSLHQPPETTVSYSNVEGNAILPAANSDFAFPNGQYTPTRIELEAWNATRAKENT